MQVRQVSSLLERELRSDARSSFNAAPQKALQSDQQPSSTMLQLGNYSLAGAGAGAEALGQ